jgi:hypothetical protein
MMRTFVKKFSAQNLWRSRPGNRSAGSSGDHTRLVAPRCRLQEDKPPDYSNEEGTTPKCEILHS